LEVVRYRKTVNRCDLENQQPRNETLGGEVGAEAVMIPIRLLVRAKNLCQPANKDEVTIPPRHGDHLYLRSANFLLRYMMY